MVPLSEVHCWTVEYPAWAVPASEAEATAARARTVTIVRFISVLPELLVGRRGAEPDSRSLWPPERLIEGAGRRLRRGCQHPLRRRAVVTPRRSGLGRRGSRPPGRTGLRPSACARSTAA